MSDWTGGSANRQYRSGTPAAPVADVDEITAKVREYLFDCARFRLEPTEKGCLREVYHQGDAQKKAVIAAYQEQMGGAHG